ncbi:hypothetical protein ScPMuIL_002126, partial [Solemya velum]
LLGTTANQTLSRKRCLMSVQTSSYGNIHVQVMFDCDPAPKEWSGPAQLDEMSQAMI